MLQIASRDSDLLFDCNSIINYMYTLYMKFFKRIITCKEGLVWPALTKVPCTCTCKTTTTTILVRQSILKASGVARVLGARGQNALMAPPPPPPPPPLAFGRTYERGGGGGGGGVPLAFGQQSFLSETSGLISWG